MSVSDGPRRHGAAHPIRNTLVVGGAATLGGVAVATGAVAAGAIATAAGLAVVGVAGYVGMRALGRKAASGYRNVQAGRQRRREARVANGGRRHGVGGKLLDAAAGNPGLLALGATAATIGLLTTTPFLLVGGAAVGVGVMVRNLLRNRAQARGIQRQPGTLSQVINTIRQEAAARQAERASEPQTSRTPERTRVPEQRSTPEQQPVPERRAPATVAAAAEPPVAPARVLTTTGSHRTAARRAAARRSAARTAGQRPPARRVSERPGDRTAAAPAATLSTGDPTAVRPVPGVTSLVERRQAQIAAETPAATVTTEAQAVPVRRRAPGVPGPGVPAGGPGGPGPKKKSDVVRAA